MILVSPSQSPAVVTSVITTVTSVAQLSVKVGIPNAGVAPQSIVISIGTLLATGASVSPIVIVAVAVLAFPQASVAVNVRVTVTPQIPELVVSSTKVIVTAPLQLSVATASSKSTIVPIHCALILGGTNVNTGATSSLIVIV